MVRRVLFLLAVVVTIFTIPFWPRESRRPCARDIARFCTGVPEGAGRIEECLAKHRDALSRPCRAYLNSVEVKPAPGAARVSFQEDDSASAPFSASYEAGQRDVNGNFMGGTELMNLVAYQGKLYAGVGYWEDKPGTDPSPGAQILVKDSARAKWRVDHTFSPADANGQDLRRVTALDVVTFATDADGKPLREPISMLVAGFDVTESSNEVAFGFSRDERTGKWIRFTVESKSFRAVTTFRDPDTGVDRVFLGAGGVYHKDSKLISGVYDPKALGRIKWDKDEFNDFGYRVMAFAKANGHLYFSAKPAVYERYKNGANPEWRKVYGYGDRVREPHHIVEGVFRIGGNSGMRGLTGIPNPDGPGEALLGVVEGIPGEVIRLNPQHDYSATVEEDIDSMLLKRWGYLPGRNVEPGVQQGSAPNNGYILAAYNGIPAVGQNPKTHQPLYFIGMQSHDPLPKGRDSAWYLIREEPGQFTLHEVRPLATRLGREKPLVAVRAAIISPFPEERGKIVYMGGYDCDWRPAHNTAWIYRAGLETVLHAP